MRIELGRVGASTLITPREIIRDFIELLDILYQNPGVGVAELLRSDSFAFAQAPVGDDDSPVDEKYAEFTI